LKLRTTSPALKTHALRCKKSECECESEEQKERRNCFHTHAALFVVVPHGLPDASFHSGRDRLLALNSIKKAATFVTASGGEERTEMEPERLLVGAVMGWAYFKFQISLHILKRLVIYKRMVSNEFENSTNFGNRFFSSSKVWVVSLNFAI
jgi:hypothetical protein